MTRDINLSDKIERQLPTELVAFIRTAGDIAVRKRQKIYLVGGAVRDLLLGQTTVDLDLVVEGSAIELAQRLSAVKLGKITVHRRFNTAKVQWDKWSVDFTTARSETYTRPGALPTVKPSSINDDLFRRDFTINAMAVGITPNRYGELIDLYGGRADLGRKFIRALHAESFIDDATRIWRSLRYEQRLNFQIESSTLALIKRDISMLNTISGDRIWYELECILREERPEKALRRAGELGVLSKLSPTLTGNGQLAERFEQVRQISELGAPPPSLYLALLAYPLTSKENEQLISRLRLTKTLSQTLRDTIDIRDKLPTLEQTGLTPSNIYRLLLSYSPQAVSANLLACDSAIARRHIQLFLDRLRYIKPILNGNTLQQMGITPGPRMKEILDLLREARLDERVTSKEGEVKIVKGLLNRSS